MSCIVLNYVLALCYQNDRITKTIKLNKMKKQSNTLFSSISLSALENLTTIVNETVATGFAHPAKKSLTVAELWNIQRQGKSRIQRRYSL